MESGIRSTFLMLLPGIGNEVGREINSCPGYFRVPFRKPDEELALSSGYIKYACPGSQRQKCDELLNFLKTHRIADNVLPMRDVKKLPPVHAYTFFVSAAEAPDFMTCSSIS